MKFVAMFFVAGEEGCESIAESTDRLTYREFTAETVVPVLREVRQIGRGIQEETGRTLTWVRLFRMDHEYMVPIITRTYGGDEPTTGEPESA